VNWRDRLPHAVLVDFERVALQAGDRMSVLVRDRGGEAGDLDPGLEDAVVGDRLLGDEARGDQRRRGAGKDESGPRTGRAHSPC